MASNGENIFCAYYKNDIITKTGELKKDRDLEIINLNTAAKLKSFGLFNNGQIEVYRRDKNDVILIKENGSKERPHALLTVGLKVIFYSHSINELKKQDGEDNTTYKKRLSDRTYKIAKFSGGQITFIHHMDARDEKQQMIAYPEAAFFKKDDKGKDLTFGKRGKNGFTEEIIDFMKYNNGRPWHKLLYTKDWLDMAIEGKEFEVNMDGSINWINGR